MTENTSLPDDDTAATELPEVPASPPSPLAPKPIRLREQVWSFKTLVAVAAISVVVGGGGGAAIVALAHHDDGARSSRSGFGPGERPMNGPGMRRQLRDRAGNNSQQQPGQPPTAPGQPATPVPSAKASS